MFLLFLLLHVWNDTHSRLKHRCKSDTTHLNTLWLIKPEKSQSLLETMLLCWDYVHWASTPYWSCCSSKPYTTDVKLFYYYLSQTTSNNSIHCTTIYWVPTMGLLLCLMPVVHCSGAEMGRCHQKFMLPHGAPGWLTG